MENMSPSSRGGRGSRGDSSPGPGGAVIGAEINPAGFGVLSTAMPLQALLKRLCVLPLVSLGLIYLLLQLSHGCGANTASTQVNLRGTSPQHLTSGLAPGSQVRKKAKCPETRVEPTGAIWKCEGSMCPG